MHIASNIGPHLRYPFDLAVGGWLVVAGPATRRAIVIDALHEAAFDGPHPLWRQPPVITTRPPAQSAADDATHHRLVVRPALAAGRFVISDGSWFGAPDADSALASDDAYSTQQPDMWLTDWPSLVLCMLDGTADTASRFMRAGQYLRPLVLLPSREGRGQTLDRVFGALRTYRLHGVLRPGPRPTSAARA